MWLALIALEFDPLVRVGDRLVRLESLVLAAGILGALLLAARLAPLTPAADERDRTAPDGTLRAGDLLFIVLAAVPGAVVGGRLGYGLLHLDYYSSTPGAILDPSQGSLQLGLAIVGGAVTGGVAARLLGEPVGRWFHVAALPLLVGIATGKLAMAFGGSGQGLPTNVPWATAYLGAGPWGSLAPELPSHPSQLYEAAASAVILAGAVGLLASGAFSRRDGRLFLAVLAAWAIARTVVAVTWREAPVLGPLRADQLISIAIAAASIAILLADRRPRGADSRRGSIVSRPSRERSGSPDEL